MKYISFKDTKISSCGIGTTGLWFGNSTGIHHVILKALYEYGVNVIATAEMYDSCHEPCHREWKDTILRCIEL